MVRRPSPFKPLAAALVALLATLALGASGPIVAGVAGLLSWELFGLAIVGGAGFLAWHLAQLSALPPQPGGPVAAALPAALVPLLVFPQIGAGALAVPVLLAILLPHSARLAAGLTLAGALAATGAGPLAAGVASATMLAAAWVLRARCPAANDNPSLERAGPFWPVPNSPLHARENTRDSGSGFGE